MSLRSLQELEKTELEKNTNLTGKTINDLRYSFYSARSGITSLKINDHIRAYLRSILSSTNDSLEDLWRAYFAGIGMTSKVSFNDMVRDFYANRGFYLFYDDFRTALSAGAINGTSAEPTGGVRTVVDTLSKLTISGAKLKFATGGGAANDPGLWLAGVSSTPGLACKASIFYSAQGLEAGFDSGQSGAISEGIRFSTSTLSIRNNGNARNVGFGTLLGTNQTIEVITILRASGAYTFAKGNLMLGWTLVGRTLGFSSATVYAAIGATGTTSVGEAEYLRGFRLNWLPSPIISDGFGSSFGTSDGLGHAEGITGGIGSGGSGVSWTTVAGTWGITSGKAKPTALTGGIALAVAESGVTNQVTFTKVSRSTGSAGPVVRYLDANNYVYAIHNGTNAQMIKRVAGVETTLVDVAATYSADANLQLSCDGNLFVMMYNEIIAGSTTTIIDANLQTGTKVGIISTDTANTVNDYVCFDKGNNTSRYSLLNSF